METVYQDEFVTMSLDLPQSLLMDIWEPQSEELTEEKFKELILIWQKFMLDYQLVYALTDTSSFKIPLSPDVQEWLVQNIATPTSQQGAYAYQAFVVPSEFYANLSFEQFIEDGNEGVQRLRMEYFEDFHLAKAWLLKNEKTASSKSKT